MNAWEILLSKSTLSAGTAWELLNNLRLGEGVYNIFADGLEVAVACDDVEILIDDGTIEIEIEDDGFSLEIDNDEIEVEIC